MSDWKGHKARISVRERLRYGSREVHSETVLLDTDTVTDLFERYDLNEHSFTIYPEWPDED